MIDQLGEWDETSASYTTARHMVDMVIRRGGYKIYPSRPALQLCPEEYFATSMAPASRTIRLSDGTEEEVTVSIVPHDAAEGACEVIVSFKKKPQPSSGNSSDAVVD